MVKVDEVLKRLKREFPALQVVFKELKTLSSEELTEVKLKVDESFEDMQDKSRDTATELQKLKKKIPQLEDKITLIKERLDSLPPEENNFTDAEGRTYAYGYRYHPLEHHLTTVELNTFRRLESAKRKYETGKEISESQTNRLILYSHTVDLIKGLLEDPNYELPEKFVKEDAKTSPPLGLGLSNLFSK